MLFEYPIQSDGSDFSIHPGFARLGLQVLTALRFLPPGGATRAFEFHGDPGLVRLDPRGHQAALRFVESGFFHILDGTDHLLFILCLVIPFRFVVAERIGIIILSAFVAHTGWHWMLERGERLGQFPLPALDAALLESAMRSLMAVLILGGLVWPVNEALRHWMQRR